MKKQQNTAAPTFPAVLDACCGGRMFWWNKENTNALFMDFREVEKRTMNIHNFGKKSLIGLSLLTAGLCAGCGESPDKPEIKQCIDAGGIPIRSIWDEKMLAECTFRPFSK